MQINKYKNGLSSGWFSQSQRHSNARKFGIAGGLYVKSQKIVNTIYNDNGVVGKITTNFAHPNTEFASYKYEIKDGLVIVSGNWEEGFFSVDKQKGTIKLSDDAISDIEQEISDEFKEDYTETDLYAKKKNYIKGGIGDKTDISKLNQEELKKGIKVELEHTSNSKIAREIASDHLTEDKDYYKKLSIMEKSKLSDMKVKDIWHEKLGYISEDELESAKKKYPLHRYWKSI